MRSGSKVFLIVGTVAGLLGSLGPSAPGAGASGTSSAPVAAASSADQLRARRAELETKLAAVLGASTESRHRLSSVESDLAATQVRLAQTRTALDAADATLKDLSVRIASDEHSLALSRAQLGALLRSTYEVTSSDGFAGAILSANDFSQAMDRVQGAQHITEQLKSLQQQVGDAEAALLDERTQVQKRGADAQQLENALSEQTGRLVEAVAERDIAVNSLQGPARDLAAEIAAIDDQLAPHPPAAAAPAPASAPVGPVNASSSCGNHFAFGYCTYYVATRRCIPWLGNAYQWWGNARAAGFAEGQTPARGAVAVWGQYGPSPVGHVAYVEAVGPTSGVPAGSFLISEMNYSGWDRVDYRVVTLGAAGLLGFIYGHL